MVIFNKKNTLYPVLTLFSTVLTSCVGIFALLLLLGAGFWGDALGMRLPAAQSMGMNTMMCLLLTSLGLLSSGLPRAVLGGAVMMSAMTTIIQFMLDFYPEDSLWRLLINTRIPLGMADVWKGRMSLAAAFSLTLLGFLLVMPIRVRTVWGVMLIQLLFGTVFVIAVIDLYGALFNVIPVFEPSSWHLNMSRLTALCILLLEVGFMMSVLHTGTLQIYYHRREDRQVFAMAIVVAVLMSLAAGLDEIWSFLSPLLGYSEKDVELIGGRRAGDLGKQAVNPQFALFVLGIMAAVMLAHVARKITQCLQYQEMLLSKVLEALPVGVWITDSEGHIVSGNPAGQAIWRGSEIVDINPHGEHQGWRHDTGEFIVPEEWALARAIRYGETSLREMVDIQCFDGNRKTILNSGIPLRDNFGEIIGAIAVNQDITDNLKAAKDLCQSQQFFQMAFDQAAIGMVICNIEGCFLQVNNAFCSMVGYNRDELIGMHFTDITNTEDADSNLLMIRRLLDGENQRKPIEKCYRHKNGEVIWTLLSLALIYDDASQPLNFFGQIIDISERKQFENQLQRWQDIFKHAAWGVALGSADGASLDMINPVFAHMHGYTVEELTGQPIISVFAPEERAGLLMHIQQAHQQGHRLFESRHLRKDGSVFPVEIDIAVVYDVDGAVLYRVVNVKDITARKQTEQALEYSEKLFHSIVENVPVMIFLKNADDLRFELINKEVEKILGYSRQEMLGKTDYDFFPKQDADFFTFNDRAVLASRQSANIEEESVLTRNGDTCFLQTLKIGLYDDNGISTHLLGVSLDITERRNAENALRISEASLNRAQSVAQVGSWALDVRTNVLTWSPEIYRIFGIEKDAPLSYETFLAGVHPDDRESVDRMWKAALQGARYDIEHRLLVNNEVRWVRERAELEIDAEGQLIGGIGTTQDITARKLSENALLESNEKLNALYELSSLGIALTDMAGRYLEFNESFRRITGYTGDELKALDYWRLTPPKYEADEQRQLALLAETGQYGPYEKEFIRKDGSLVPLRLNGMSVRGRDGLQYIWSIVEDITASRQAEKELNERSAEQHRLLETQASILDALPANIVLIDQQGIIQATNRRWDAFARENTSAPIQACVGYSYLDVCENAVGEGAQDARCVSHGIRHILAGDSDQFSYEYACHQPDRQRWFLLQVTPLSSNDQSGGAVVMHLDITESHLAKQRLHEREEEFRALVENSPDLIFRVDSECRYLYVNPVAESMLGIPPRTFIGKELDSFGLSDDALKNIREAIFEVFDDGVGKSAEFSFRVLQQEHRFHARFVPEFNQQMAVVSVLSVIRDISETKNFEIALSQSRQLLREMAAQNEKTREQERKRIAREVHDELGQILTALRMDISLLRLRFGADNPELLEKIRGVLALVDRAIKTVRNVATHLRPAVLDMGVLASLTWLSNEFTEHTGVPCKLYSAGKSYNLDETRAVQVFRIIQESLTNIARHAEATQASIIIERRDNQLWVEVRDDGKGFDSTKPSTQKSFGLLGMRERAIVLGGDIGIISAPGQGTVISLLIPLE